MVGILRCFEFGWGGCILVVVFGVLVWWVCRLWVCWLVCGFVWGLGCWGLWFWLSGWFVCYGFGFGVGEF